MPNRRTHDAIGILVGLGFGLYAVRNRNGWPAMARLAGWTLGAKLGAALPDGLEPGLHSWHRGPCHSGLALAGSLGLLLDPPEGLQQWVAEHEAAARWWKARYEQLPAGHCDRLGLWLTAAAEEFVVGLVQGLAAGYASHLFLDGGTPRGLPLLG